MTRVGVDILLRARGDLTALDSARSRVAAVRAEIGSLTSIVTGGALLGFGQQLAGAISAIPQAMAGAIRQGVAFNAQIESGSVSFETLLGSANAARQRMHDLYTFAASTPFQLTEVVNASRQLQAFTNNALSSGDGLRLVGDAAAAVGAPFEQAARNMGRLFLALRIGGPMGEALQNLGQMALLTGDARTQLLGLQGTVHSQAQAMEVFQNIFGRFNGAMQRQSVTFSGLVSTMKDAWASFLGQATQPIFDVIREQLGGVNAALADPKLVTGLRTFLRGLADILKIGLENAPVLFKMVELTGMLAAGFALFKITTFVRGMIEWGLSVTSATAAEGRHLAALEAKVLAMTAQQAQLQRIIALQTQVNALQAAGAVSAARGGAISLGLAGAELTAAGRAAAIRNINDTFARTPGLMANVGSAAGRLAAGLNVISLAVVVGIFGINYWKNWRLDAIEAMDAVRAAAANRVSNLRQEVDQVRTEDERKAVLEKAEKELAQAQEAVRKRREAEIRRERTLGPVGFSVPGVGQAVPFAPRERVTRPVDFLNEPEVLERQRLVDFIRSSSAEQLKESALKRGKAPDIVAAREAAQAEREALEKESQEAAKKFEEQMAAVRSQADQAIARAQLENQKLQALAQGDRRQAAGIDLQIEASRLAEELRVNDPLLSDAQRATARQALNERVELKRRELEVQLQLASIRASEIPAEGRLAQIAGERANIEQSLLLNTSTRRLRLEENTAAYRDQVAAVLAIKEAELSLITDVEQRARFEREIANLRQQAATYGKGTEPQSRLEASRTALAGLKDPAAHFQKGEGLEGGANNFFTQLGTDADFAAERIENSLNEGLRGTQDLLYGLATGALTFSQAWDQATAWVGQQFLRMTTDMVARMIYRATVERSLIALGVITHTQGEGAKTAATVSGGAIRLGTVIKEALASVYHGALEAFKALAGIPVAGPFLGAAAMAAAIAGGIALVGKIGHADGAIIRGPGGPRDDRIPAMLSNGEAVTRASVVSRFGEEFFKKLNAGVLDLSAIRGGVARADGGMAIASGFSLSDITIPDLAPSILSRRESIVIASRSDRENQSEVTEPRARNTYAYFDQAGLKRALRTDQEADVINIFERNRHRWNL